MLSHPTKTHQHQHQRKLPSITPDMTHPQYRKFMVDWSIYKSITTLPSSDVTAHLYSTCDISVQNSIINAVPGFLILDETSALEAIEKIVTRHINPAIHRMTFAAITQGEHESTKYFVIRLRSAAVECECTCPECEHDLSTTNIRNQFIRGLTIAVSKLISSQRPVS